MFSTILVGIDGSDYSMRALEHAFFLQEKFGSSVTAVHVVPLPSAIYGDYPAAALRLLEQLEANGKKILDTAKELAEKRGLTVKTVLIRHADPAEEILKLSEKEKCDLIILGSRGLSGIKRFLIGSVSAKVNRYAKCAVLTVK